MRLIEPACHSSYQTGQLTGNFISNTVESFFGLGEGTAGRWEVAEDGLDTIIWKDPDFKLAI